MGFLGNLLGFAGDGSTGDCDGMTIHRRIVAHVDAQLAQIGALDATKMVKESKTLNRIRRILIEGRMEIAKLGSMPKP